MVLLENQCYVRFLPLSGEPRPPEDSKFCIIRVGPKPHRVLLNVGFLEGTCNEWRQEVGKLLNHMWACLRSFPWVILLELLFLLYILYMVHACVRGLPLRSTTMSSIMLDN